jgi:hypothetical protein
MKTILGMGVNVKNVTSDEMKNMIGLLTVNYVLSVIKDEKTYI